MAAKVVESQNFASSKNEGAITYKLRKFTETDKVNCILDSIAATCETGTKTERAIEDLREILDRYQEQPHLLDPYLESFTSKLLSVAQDYSLSQKITLQAFKYLYLFTKVRGSKYIVRLFPHEVQDVEKVLSLLNKQNPSDHESWEARYILLLWLSIVCMVPFDMSRFDGNIAETSEQKPITQRIIDLAKVYLNVVDKCRDAAALVIAKFVTRPDVKTQHLPDYLKWSLGQLPKIEVMTQAGTNTMTGIFSSLALLFKHGKRADLIVHARIVRETIDSCNVLTLNNSLLRKLYIKLVQRLGLTFLKPRLAAWRYKRGTRSLCHNLTKSELTDTITTNKDEGLEEELDENFDVPEDIEDIIEILLVGLKEKDTIVRWSAAKGVGRITGRLPKELADDIVAAVLDLFSFQETDSAWHGGCLALAELGRRGLLLPQRLSEVVPVVLKALLYDERRGAISVGSNVRDAACYVCWSFARAYDPVEIKPYIEEIARGLLIATLFDRDINCRRAASAAFQENVGRQGTLPHGIDILTKTDYYEVGNRKNTYLTISVYIAQYDEYRQSLIDHLYKVKLCHWDMAVRELVSKALFNLTARDPEMMAELVLRTILPQTVGLDLHARHGSVLCAAEITHALYCYGVENNRSLEDILSASCIGTLEEIIPKLTEAKLFRGQGGELMRPAACHFIEKMSVCNMDCIKDETIVSWRSTIDDNINHQQRPIQEKAVSALRHFTICFYKMKNGSAVPDLQDSLITTYIKNLKHSSETAREGFALALGVLPKFMLNGYLAKVIEGLLGVTEVREKDAGKFAQSRADALHSLASIAETVGVERDGDCNCAVDESTLIRLFHCCFKAMNDYTIDSRGDVGSWSRKAAMTCLLKLTLVVTEMDAELLSEKTCDEMMCCLLKQCSEKIDHTRAHAGEIMLKLIHKQNPGIPNIPEHKLLCDIFPRKDSENLNWGAAAEVFRKISQLLEIPCYQYAVLSGIILSAGGLSESLIRQAGISLENFLGRLSARRQDEALTGFAENLVKLFKEYEKNDRVIIPLFKVLDNLLSIGSLSFLAKEGGEKISEALFELTQNEIVRIPDARKIIISINVFSGLLQFPGNTRRRCLQRLLILLCHKYPRVRKATADSLYTALITYEDIASEEKMEVVLDTLSETSWEDDVDKIRPQRNILCDLLGVPKPVLKNTAKKQSAPQTLTTEDPLSSYKDLVCRVDY
ncbi:tubulin-specific chaperone D-like [Dendronephthya gigantea]|uniref:tubulin-specific chaperone D-like n=1 Tax=Dendronephthya gigantea TaxID=151771 RepID=UPI00106CA142|nr:tubulin-specific chaperone D-like [Dendronephthya gigantea]